MTDTSAPRPPTDQAEEMVDQFGRQVGQAAAQVGLAVMRAVAIAREELEDIWAEAQHVRHSQEP